jgi:hypothetical protein
MRAIIAGCLAGLLAGCYVPTIFPTLKVPDEVRAQIAANRPHCDEPRQCEAMWAAARNWVVSSCGMKIQTATDGFIETYNSRGNLLACRVWRDPAPEGGYDFHGSFGCEGRCYESGYYPPALAMENAINEAGKRFATASAIPRPIPDSRP